MSSVTEFSVPRSVENGREINDNHSPGVDLFV